MRNIIVSICCLWCVLTLCLGEMKAGIITSSKFEVFKNQVFNSALYSRRATSSSRECANLCGQDDLCTGANFLENSQCLGSYCCDLLQNVTVVDLTSSTGDKAIRKLVPPYCETLPAHPCQNGGICVSGDGDYTCTCPSHCSGDTCGCCIHHTFPLSIETVDVSSPTLAFTTKSIDIYKERDSEGVDWIIIMRRHDGALDFAGKSWAEYKAGFGSLSSEFWIGNDNIYYLTNNGSDYTIRFNMRSFPGECRYADYSFFRLGPESDGYRLAISGYSGDAGDGMTSQAYSGNVDSSNMKFSTFDRDNDLSPTTDCMAEYFGAWWARACFYSKLTGIYGESTPYGHGALWISWLGFESGPEYMEMKIKVN